MKELPLEILPPKLLKEYQRLMSGRISETFEALTDSELSANTFSFYTSVSAVFSSKIEGEDIELDSFIKHKKWGAKFLPDHTQKTDDLYEAYQFAQKAKLDISAIKQAHTLLTKHILQKAYRGKLRTGNMYVTTSDGRIEYVACVPAMVSLVIVKYNIEFRRSVFLCFVYTPGIC
jgi:hypothetical protein